MSLSDSWALQEFFCLRSDVCDLSLLRRASVFDLWLSSSTSAEPTAIWAPSTWRFTAGYVAACDCCKCGARYMFLHPVLTALTLLSAHGAHHRRHRGPLWAVEPLLLERQVRASSLLLFARSARQQLRSCTHISLRLLLLTAQLVPVIKFKAKDSAVKPKRGGSFSLPALSCSLCFFFLFGNAIVYSGTVWEFWLPIRFWSWVQLLPH